MRPSLAAVLSLVAALALPNRAAASSQISLHTDDGVTIGAAWDAPSHPAPAVLLLHSYMRSHADWDPVASRLHDAGFGVLALDLRGHGSSAGPMPSESLQPFTKDVKAAVDWLKRQPDVLSGHIGIAGLNLGATLAIIEAGADPAIRSLALVSPAAEFRGLRADQAMRTFAARSGAAWLAAGGLDPYASRSARQLADITPGVRDLRIIENSAANGRALLADQPDVAPALVDWFRKTLL
jgi:alpha-beta hydrolase superfamily lysophospholipase